VNSVVLTDAQPAYSPDGRALLASSSLSPGPEAEVRDEIAIQGAMASGARAARAVLRSLRPSAHPSPRGV
jgi:hypothetical protein